MTAMMIIIVVVIMIVIIIHMIIISMVIVSIRFLFINTIAILIIAIIDVFGILILCGTRRTADRCGCWSFRCPSLTLRRIRDIRTACLSCFMDSLLVEKMSHPLQTDFSSPLY